MMSAMTVALQSGHEWEDDPAGEAHAHGGRTIRRDMRSRTDPSKLVIVKRPKPLHPVEIYCIGMERVAYCLADHLGLPVPAVHLDPVDGHHSSVQDRILNGRTWMQLPCAPGMAANIVGQDQWPLAVLFDVWMANTDRRDMNLLFEPIPAGKAPGRATGCKMWLIDQGQCGLWPGDKLQNGHANEIPEGAGVVNGELREQAEIRIYELMPVEYRRTLKNLHGPARKSLLDRIRSVGDDVIEHAMCEVPEAYISNDQGEATVSFLKGRRDRLDKVVEARW